MICNSRCRGSLIVFKMTGTAISTVPIAIKRNRPSSPLTVYRLSQNRMSGTVASGRAESIVTKVMGEIGRPARLLVDSRPLCRLFDFHRRITEKNEGSSDVGIGYVRFGFDYG